MSYLLARITLVLALAVSLSACQHATTVAATEPTTQPAADQHTFSAVLQEFSPDSAAQQAAPLTHLYEKGSLRRSENGDTVWIQDAQTGQTLQLNTTAHFAVSVVLKPDHQCMSDTVKRLAADATQPLGTKRFGNRTLDGFAGSTKASDDPDGPEAIHVWVDPQSHFPVRIEVYGPVAALRPTPKAVFDDIQFDIPLADSLFSMTPKDYRIENFGGLKPEQLKPAATQSSADLLLKPGVGIGSLHFGATRQQIIAALGPPEVQLSTGDALQYPSRGLILYAPAGTGLKEISAYSSNDVAWNSNDFPDQTTEGIRIGSTLKDVLAAYGPPAQRKGSQVQSELIYSKLSMTIQLIDGRVSTILLTQPKTAG